MCSQLAEDIEVHGDCTEGLDGEALKGLTKTIRTQIMSMSAIASVGLLLFV